MKYPIVIDSIETEFKISGTQTKRLMGENVVDINLSLPGFIDFKIGSKITVYGEEYELNTLPNYKKQSTFEFDYSMQFQALFYRLAKYNFLGYDSENQLTEATFPLMGNAETFIDLILANANRIDPGWSKGVIEETEYRNELFSEEKCLSVLGRIADLYKKEFFFVGKVLHFTKRGQNSGLSVSYGKNKGLRSLTRTSVDSKQLVTRLWVYGSDKNLPADYRAKKLKMPISVGHYIEKNVDKYGIIEHTISFDNYPHREGTVTAIGDEFTFADSSIDFNINDVLLPGQPAKLTFNTGLLAGYEFILRDFNNTTKTFIFNKNDDEKAFDVPSEILKPAIGDKFVITNIQMPPVYVENEEIKVYDKGFEYLDQNADPHVQYALEPDPFFLERSDIEIQIGDYVNVVDDQIGIDKDIRTIGYVRDIENPYQYNSLDISDTVSVASIARQVNEKLEIQKAIKLNNLSDVNRTRQSWRTIQEAMSMVVDTEGNYYSDKIKPLSIETAAITIGQASQQFKLAGIVFTENFESDVNKVNWTAGILHHYSGSETAAWNITGGTISGLEPSKPYYIYGKCSTTTSDGTIVFSAVPISVNEVAGFYHYLIGSLSSVIDGLRVIGYSYGFASINGRTIAAGEIRSPGGEVSVDLDQGIISGRIRFGNSGASTIIDDKLVTTSVIILGNGIMENAGISGEGTLTTSIRHWAGATFANRNTATFRVQDDGKMFASAGRIANFTIDGSGLVNTDGNAYVAVKKTQSGGEVGASIGAGIATTLWGSSRTAAGVFVNTVPNSSSSNIGIVVDVSGSSFGGNIAIDIKNGFINIPNSGGFILMNGAVPIEALTTEFITGSYRLTFIKGILVKQLLA